MKIFLDIILKNWKNISLIVLVFFCILITTLLFQSKEKHRTSLENYSIQEHELEEKENKIGMLVFKNKSYIATNEEMRKAIWIKDDSLKAMIKENKRVSAALVISTQTNVRNLKTELKTHEYKDTISNTTQRVSVFKFLEKDMEISGRIINDNIYIDSLDYETKLRVVLGETKRSWFKYHMTASVSSSNKNTRITGILSQTKSYPVKRLGLAAHTGIDFKGNINASIGLSYIFWFF